MAILDSVLNLLDNILPKGADTRGILDVSGDELAASDDYVISLNIGELPETKTAAAAVVPETKSTAEEIQKNLLADISTSSVTAVIELGGSTAVSKIERKLDIKTLRNYARYSVWVRAAIDYHRRMIGRAGFEIVAEDTTQKFNRVDKFVLKETKNLLKYPNAAGESYNTIKEQFVEDYLVVGAGIIELELRRDLTPMAMRIVDAANIGFIKTWDGTDNRIPRYVEFADAYSTRVKRYLAHEQLMCLVNRPMSDSKLGMSHVEILHRTVIALLSGDEFLIKQIIQPIPDTLISLGEGVTKQQVDDFKYQLQQVRDKLAVTGGTKNAQVMRLSATSEEMRILDSQEWFVRQVAAIFGMSTAKLKLAVDTSRANTESMFDDDLEAVTGELTRIEELETATLINRYSYLGDVNLKLFYPIMHRKDEQTQARIAAMQTRGQGWASTNEARMRTGEKALDEKDFPFANEPLVIVKGEPVPMSIWQEYILNFEKRANDAAARPAAQNNTPEDEESGDKKDDDETGGQEEEKQ